jgi:hypothetical protein
MNGCSAESAAVQRQSMDLSGRSMRAVWHPCTQMQHLHRTPPLAITTGKGAWNTLYVMPPYVFDEADAYWMGRRVLKTLDSVLGEKGDAYAA